MSATVEFERGLQALGLTLAPEVRQRLLDYVALIQKWNRVYNLTAIREPEKMLSHHLLDSLAVVPHIHAARVLDVGSGAGLPGIPLALARPQTQVTLLDSNHKKAAFLNQAVIELRLNNVSVCAERVESWRPPLRFDAIVSRAFADLAEFVRVTLHLLAPGGVLAAMKGVYPYEEIEKLPANCIVEQVLPLAVPGLDAARHLVLMRAIS